MVVRPLGNLEPLPLTVVRTGRTPVRQGDPCPGLWRVETGLVTLTVIDPDGRSFLVDVLGRGEPIGAPEGAASPWTVTAIRPTRLRAVAAADAPAALAEQAARLTWVGLGFAGFGVVDRLERRLLDLSARLGQPVPGGVSIPARLTQDELASMIGASRESVNRALGVLSARGVVDVRGRGRYVMRSQLRLVQPP
jgi:CRP/FNR family cyclic AMP-dependent transcriptional regulator